MQAYVQFGWIAQMLRDGGLGQTSAGLMASIIAACGIPSGLVMAGIVESMRDPRRLGVVFGLSLAVGYLGVLFAPSLALLWALCLGTSLEDRPRYTPSTTFETFPFPAGMTPADTATGAPEGPAAEAIAAAARRLDELRNNWLNPADWVDWVITPEEAAAGFPARPVARPGHEAELKKRTLTNLYNQRPAWLANAHQALDQAVAAAYGWAEYSPALADDEILRRLLKLNLERA